VIRRDGMTVKHVVKKLVSACSSTPGCTSTDSRTALDHLPDSSEARCLVIVAGVPSAFVFQVECLTIETNKELERNRYDTATFPLCVKSGGRVAS
jgi:hypothetical protein